MLKKIPHNQYYVVKNIENTYKYRNYYNIIYPVCQLFKLIFCEFISILQKLQDKTDQCYRVL